MSCTTSRFLPPELDLLCLPLSLPPASLPPASLPPLPDLEEDPLPPPSLTDRHAHLSSSSSGSMWISCTDVSRLPPRRLSFRLMNDRTLKDLTFSWGCRQQVDLSLDMLFCNLHVSMNSVLSLNSLRHLLAERGPRETERESVCVGGGERERERERESMCVRNFDANSR